MMTTPATNRQVPDHAILDHFNKQTYLGNRFSYSLAVTAGGTTEVAQLLLTNQAVTTQASQNQAALFVDLRRLTGATAAANNVLRAYLGPTVTAGAQTVGLVADSTGSLNSTFFLLNGPGNTNKYYVWFNINSAGVDPAVAGRTGIAVAGATNATAATLGTAMRTAINSAASADFTCTGTATVTITNTSTASFTAAVDGSAATGFSFAVTSAGLGTSRTPTNMRPGNSAASITSLSSAPAITSNGTLLETLAVPAFGSVQSNDLWILDPGKSLLVTLQTATSAVVVPQISWYEI